MSSQPPSVSGKKILVVDDDAVVVKALSMKLANRGYTVFTAEEPSEAVQSVRKNHPDLILLDVTFPPDMAGASWDGFRIAEWIRRLDPATIAPVIIITGGDTEKYKQKAESIGAAAFFHKPLKNDELLEVIQKTLEEWPEKLKAAQVCQ